MYISYLFIDLQHVFNVKMIFKYIHLFHVFLFVLLFCSIFSHFGSVHQLTARPVSFAIVVFWTLKKDRVTVTVTVIRNTCTCTVPSIYLCTRISTTGHHLPQPCHFCRTIKSIPLKHPTFPRMFDEFFHFFFKVNNIAHRVDPRLQRTH